MTPPELAAAAADLAARGIPVFPCGSDKAPVIAHGFKAAACDPATARRLFLNTRGAALIGMPTGPITDTCVVDIDPQGMEWFSANLRRLPETRMHRTRRGGYHLVYRCPAPALRNSAGKLSFGVDIRGEGGYVIVPPSDGYAEISDVAKAAFPKWIIRVLAKREAKPDGTDWRSTGGNLDALERFIANSRPGQRNCRVFWAACRAGEAGDKSAMSALVQAAVATGLDAVEAEAAVRSGLRYGGTSARK